jgi:outer membrane lipoprotein-sorting protein
MKYCYLMAALAGIFLSVSFRKSAEITPAGILSHMFDSIKNIKTLRIKVAALERLGDHFSTSNSEIKLRTSPRQLYFINPEKKLEVLYLSGKLNNKALVKPNVFPYFTLNLDPIGNIMRRNQHYTINELGFDFIAQSIALTISKDKEGIKKFTYHGKVKKNGYLCYLLEYENKNYGYTDYTVGERETVSSISAKLAVNDYLVRSRNDLLNDFGLLKKGSSIKIPTLYCKRAVMYIDEKLFVPVSISLYDDIGIFESYDFTAIEINTPIKDEEFTRNYKGYSF